MVDGHILVFPGHRGIEKADHELYEAEEGKVSVADGM